MGVSFVISKMQESKEALAWNAFFSNEAFHRNCPPGEEGMLADGMPMLGIMEMRSIYDSNMPEARLKHSDLIARLSSMTHTERMEFIERVIVRHIAMFPEDEKFVYLTVKTST